jgi:hypothetical protein
MSSVPSRSNEPIRVTKRLLVLIGIAGFVIGAIIAIVLHVRGPACEVPVDDVPWAAFRLDEIEASMRRVKKDEAWAGTRGAIDAFGAKWGASYLRACELPEGPAREAAYACINDALGRADAVLDALRLLDPEAIANAESAITSLPTCDE